MINDSEDAFDAREIACSNHRKSLSKTMQAQRHYFFLASEYNLTHGATTATQFSVRDRRLARDFFQIEKDVGNWPQPLVRHCERILASDRDNRIALIRERRHATRETVLPHRRAVGGGDVIPFPAARQAAARQAVSA